VLLHAENPAYAPILATELRILGKVVGLLRGIS
jgi:SOS-response transcriptional repressor LexA